MNTPNMDDLKAELMDKIDFEVRPKGFEHEKWVQDIKFHASLAMNQAYQAGVIAGIQTSQDRVLDKVIKKAG